jgi:predicted DNA-binding protein (UPF0251 family)
MNPLKWRRQYSRDQIPLIPVVCLGAAVFADTIRGTVPSLVKRLRQLLRDAEANGRLIYMEIDEYFTSQRCSSCLRRSLASVEIENGDLMYAVLRCGYCRKTWQRDVNAARNILAVVLYQIYTRSLGRPHNLEKQ